MKTLVLGLGNTLLKDDGVAIRIIQSLEPTLASQGIEARTSNLSGLALIDEILGYERVIVVDAVKSGQHKIGEIFLIKQNIEHIRIFFYNGINPLFIFNALNSDTDKIIFLKIFSELKRILRIEVNAFSHVEENGGFVKNQERNIFMME